MWYHTILCDPNSHYSLVRYMKIILINSQNSSLGVSPIVDEMYNDIFNG